MKKHKAPDGSKASRRLDAGRAEKRSSVRRAAWLGFLLALCVAASVRSASLPGRVGRVAWIWEDSAQGKLQGFAALHQTLSAAGFTVRTVGTDTLAAAHALSRATTDLLVLPYADRYPLPLASSLTRYLRKGGGLMTFGANPLTEPLWHSPKGWVPVNAVDTAVPGLTVPLTWQWLVRHLGPKDSARMEPDPGCGYARFSFPDLAGYAYVGTHVPRLPDAPAVLCFEARGDGHTPRLCIELQARDRSRWKYVVALGRDWRSYRIHLSEFVSYASKGRGAAGDACAAPEVDLLLFGFTAPMAGRGHHRFDLRQVQFRRGLVPATDLARASWFARGGLEAERWFGKLAHCPRRTASPLGTGFSLPEKAGELVCPSGPLGGGGVTGRGAWQVAALAPVAPLPPSGGRHRASLAQELRQATAGRDRLALLQARGRELRGTAVVATLALNRQGPFAGSRIAQFGLDLSAVRDSAPVQAAVAEAAAILRTGVRLGGPRPRFRVDGNALVMDVVVPAQNASARQADIPLHVDVRGVGGKLIRSGDATVRVPARQTVPRDMAVLTGIPVPAAGLQAFSVAVSLPKAASRAAFMPRRTFTLDTRAALKTICDFMLAQARHGGKLSGYSFIDNRGMRTLLAGYELFGDSRYRDTALAWGRLMLREQRPDGGYRMGYGITSRGEACYVADGGEIAVCIARLISYAHGAERRRFLASLDAYMRYRESFRVPSGGIGVGWCLTDYSRRPTVPLKKPTKIFAPEKNTYTVGCSLAAAYAHARLHHSRQLEQRAEGDAGWLIEHSSSLHGAFIESYMYAHHFTTDPQYRTLYAAFIRRAFTDRHTRPHAGAWWLGGAGRSALDLDGLAYVYNRLEPSPAVLAQIMTGVCAMFSPQSADSMLSLTDGRKLGHSEWIYLCYGALSLADVIHPMVTLQGFVPPTDPGK